MTTETQLLREARDMIDSLPGYPKGAELCDRIDAHLAALSAPAQPASGEAAQAWAEGYRSGVDDERTSEANVGIAGFDMKVQPARANPYLTTPPASQEQAQPSTSGWLTPTTYAHRFTNAVRLLCGKEPPADMVAGWLDKGADDHGLQEFAIEHGPAWCQGIALLDAANVMASQPTEGVDHEPAPETLRDVLQERFDVLHLPMPQDAREAVTAGRWHGARLVD